MDAAQIVGREIKPADVRQDIRIAMLGRKFAKSASPIVDAEIESFAGLRLDVVIDKIAGMSLFLAPASLLSDQSPDSEPT